MGRYAIEQSDSPLLHRLKQGDEAAFEHIYRKYSAWVYHFFNAFLYDGIAAEDLTQNVFLKIWERHKEIDPDRNFEAYLFTIARHYAYKETGRRLLSERLDEHLHDREALGDSSAEQVVEAESLRAYIDSLVEQLPPIRRRIYELSRIHHLSHKEIAEKLSISEKTVETQLYRSLQYLKRKLADSD